MRWRRGRRGDSRAGFALAALPAALALVAAALRRTVAPRRGWPARAPRGAGHRQRHRAGLARSRRRALGEAQARFDAPADARAARSPGAPSARRPSPSSTATAPRPSSDYVAVLEEAAAGGASRLRRLLAPVAAARAGALLDEVPAAAPARARIEARLLGAAARRACRGRRASSWRGSAIGSRAGAATPALLEDAGARRGLRARGLPGRRGAGGLPHLDLENPLPPRDDRVAARLAGAARRPAAASRCRRWNARPGRAGPAHGGAGAARPVYDSCSTSRARRGCASTAARSGATATRPATARACRGCASR